MAGNYWQSSHYEQWTFDKATLLRMRSKDLQIYTEDEYNKLMIFFSNVIQYIGLDPQQISLYRVKMQVIATAVTYFRRFYARRSLRDIDPFVMAPTCLYLASKVEEFGMMSTSKLMAGVSQILKQKYSFLRIDVSQRVGIIHEAEFILLEIMDCCLIVFHAYRPLTDYLQEIAQARSKQEQKNSAKDIEEFEATAFRLANDYIRGDFSLMYAPHTLAIAALIKAAEATKREKELFAWLKDTNVDFDKVEEVLGDMASMYDLWRSFNEQTELQKLLDKMPRPSAVMPQGVHQPERHNMMHAPMPSNAPTTSNMNVQMPGMGMQQPILTSQGPSMSQMQQMPMQPMPPPQQPMQHHHMQMQSHQMQMPQHPQHHTQHQQHALQQQHLQYQRQQQMQQMHAQQQLQMQHLQQQQQQMHMQSGPMGHPSQMAPMQMGQMPQMPGQMGPPQMQMPHHMMGRGMPPQPHWR